MNQEECVANGGTWNEETMMCSHPEGAEETESSDAAPADEVAEPESM